MVDSSLRSFTLFRKVMKKSMAPSLPQIRVSDMEILSDWDFENVKAFGDSIPGYRPSASMSTLIDYLCSSTVAVPMVFSMKRLEHLLYVDADHSTSLPDNPPLEPPSFHLPLRFSIQQSRLNPDLLCILVHHSPSISYTITSLDQHDCRSSHRILPTRAKTVTNTHNIHYSILGCQRTRRSPPSDWRLGGSAKTIGC